MPYEPGKCRLLSLLKKANMTQQELAERVGKTPQRINDYIHGRKMMSMATAYTISRELGVEMHQLYTWEHVPLSKK
jgi:transcriptional regulator with XRE-family HTH domain